MAYFGLKWGQDLENWAAHPTKNSEEYPRGSTILGDSTWDFWVNFWSRIFFGFVGSPGSFWLLTFSPIRSSPLLEIQSTPMGPYGRLGDRFREHLRDVEKNDKDVSKPVAAHLSP